MNRRFIAALALLPLTVTACGLVRQAHEADQQTAPVAETRPGWERHFRAQKADDGAFVLYDRNRNTFKRYNPARAATRFLPASTFKIFNTMAALDAGAVADETTWFKWDGTRHPFEAWNHDQDLKTAFKNSTVWYYQEIARRVGPERMQAMLSREGYGNANPAGGIDQFWLSGALAISPDEQIAFLRRLYDGRLGFSPRAQALTKALMLQERGPDFAVAAKTGWVRLADRNDIGWWVGWVETQDNVYFFALNLETRDKQYPMFKARPAITFAILREEGIPCPPPR